MHLSVIIRSVVFALMYNVHVCVHMYMYMYIHVASHYNADVLGHLSVQELRICICKCIVMVCFRYPSE